MRTKPPTAPSGRESISRSLCQRAFFLMPRGSKPFLRSFFFLLITASAFAQSNTQPVTPKFDGQSWWNYVKVLADDNMEGRNTGSEGLKRAEAYIVKQLKANGLQPAGTDGYYQPVKLISRRVLDSDSSLALFHEGKSEPLSFETDAYFSNRISQAPRVDAPLVFVGWGLAFRKRDTTTCKVWILRARLPSCFLVPPQNFRDRLPRITTPQRSAGRRYRKQAQSGQFLSLTLTAWISHGSG